MKNKDDENEEDIEMKLKPYAKWLIKIVICSIHCSLFVKYNSFSEAYSVMAVSHINIIYRPYLGHW